LTQIRKNVPTSGLIVKMGKLGIALLSFILLQAEVCGQTSMNRLPIAQLGSPTVSLADSNNQPAPINSPFPAKSQDIGTPQPGTAAVTTAFAPALPGNPWGPQTTSGNSTFWDNSEFVLTTPSDFTFWGSAEFVFWWVQGSHQPPLVTASPPGTALANAGVLGSPGTTILYGDGPVNNDMRPGGRFMCGFWLNEGHTCEIEAGLMLIGGQQSHFYASSDGSQIMSRPFTDATTDAQIAETVSFPGLTSGNIAVASRSDPLLIADIVFRGTLCSDCSRSTDFLVGYRYLHFAESLQIQENLTSLDALTLGTTLAVHDGFSTRNEFQGGLLGLETAWQFDAFSLQLLGKLALGNLNREVTIAGNTVITAPGAAPLAYTGGLLALSSNSGEFSSNHFVCWPEVDVTAGWQLTRHLRATAGYSLLWLTDMVRPGDQIDTTVNPNLIPPASPSAPTRPVFTLHDTDFWVQGLRLGLEFRF
jgi:Putative beta barrel porin-7 (BBP7)